MLNEMEIRLCHLHRIKSLGRKRIIQWLKIDPKLSAIYQLRTKELQQTLSLSSKQAAEVFRDLHSPSMLTSLEKDLKEFNPITIMNPRYPSMLRVIPDPPLVLYTKGKIDYLQHEPKISVIGTRNHSLEANQKINFLVKPLVEKDWLIVSGMAKGIDSMAHVVAAKNKGKTIAVLGFGFHHVYPKQNQRLMNFLAENHLLISEYPPNEPPKKWHFPERNRIISGLSFGSLIIEAKEKSGTFITAEQALEQGREVFVVPGSIFTEQTTGCHILIQEGAQLVTHSNDLFQAWQSNKLQWSYTVK